MTPREYIYRAGGREAYPSVFKLPTDYIAEHVKSLINQFFPEKDYFVSIHKDVLILVYEKEMERKDLPSSYWQEAQKLLNSTDFAVK